MGSTTRVLFFNSMFGAPLGLPSIDLPDDFEITEDRRFLRDADAVVFHVPDLPRPFLLRKPPGQLWVAWSMECDANYRRQRSTRFLRRFDLRMTYHRDADVCVSYVPAGLLAAPPVPPTKRSGHLVCSFVSGNVDRCGRRRYMRELARHVDVHAYGAKGDRTIPDDRGRSSKLAVLAEYKFTLAFENAVAPDYVTEKLYDPLKVGTVPVYRGAPNVDGFVPTPDCYIDVRDFPDPADLARRLLELDADDAAYRALLDWRARPLSPSFRALVDSVQGHPFVRLCDRIRALRAQRGSA